MVSEDFSDKKFVYYLIELAFSLLNVFVFLIILIIFYQASASEPRYKKSNIFRAASWSNICSLLISLLDAFLATNLIVPGLYSPQQCLSDSDQASLSCGLCQTYGISRNCLFAIIYCFDYLTFVECLGENFRNTKWQCSKLNVALLKTWIVLVCIGSAIEYSVTYNFDIKLIDSPQQNSEDAKYYTCASLEHDSIIRQIRVALFGSVLGITGVLICALFVSKLRLLIDSKDKTSSQSNPSSRSIDLTLLVAVAIRHSMIVFLYLSSALIFFLISAPEAVNTVFPTYPLSRLVHALTIYMAFPFGEWFYIRICIYPTVFLFNRWEKQYSQQQRQDQNQLQHTQQRERQTSGQHVHDENCKRNCKKKYIANDLEFDSELNMQGGTILESNRSMTPQENFIMGTSTGSSTLCVVSPRDSSEPTITSSPHTSRDIVIAAFHQGNQDSHEPSIVHFHTHRQTISRSER